MTKPSTLISELQSLAALTSSLPGIILEVGASGCGWSFNWSTQVITADPSDLALRPADYCRGLILHEAAHGAITRLGDIVPLDLMKSVPGLHHLLNVIEDCRIENWLQQRFPGCQPWVRLYNDRLLAWPACPESRAEIAADPARGFLMGLLFAWWHDGAQIGLHPLSQAGIAEVNPYFDQAVQAYSDPTPPDAARTVLVYESHPVGKCYSAVDFENPPSPGESVIRMTQHRMWSLTWAHIVPVFRRLLDHPDSQPFSSWEYASRPAHHSGIARPAANSSRRDAVVSCPSEDAYEAAVVRHGRLIEACAEVVLRQLVEASRPKTSRFHRCGNRLDLRVAMQFEADPRQFDRLFQRRSLPAHPDPAFIVVVDESLSMNGGRAAATFDAVVVLREVCLRLGIPLAILGFGSSTRRIQEWHDVDSAPVRGNVARLLEPIGRSSRLQSALDAAMGLQARLPESCQPRLWILSDGEVSNPFEIRRSIIAFRMGGTPIHCLGLGPDSGGLRTILPSASVGLRPEDLPEAFAKLLQVQAGRCAENHS